MSGNTDTRTVPVGAELREVQVGRHRVGVSIQGLHHHTVPLLMCNGIGGGYPMWTPLREQLPRTTIAFDVQRAFLGFPPSVRTYGHFLARVVEQLGFERADVLGLSWGAIVAQQLAHDHPERVDRLILAGSTPGFMSVPAKPGVALGLVMPRRGVKRLEGAVTTLCAGDFLKDVELPKRLGLLDNIDKPTYRRQLMALTGWSSLWWLRSVQHETLILHGSDDPIVPVVNARLVAKLMPRASLQIVQGGGHLFLHTRPEESGRRITEFLQSRTGARRAV